MSTAQQQADKQATGQSANGSSREDIQVNNPATGKHVQSVASLSADEVAEMARRGREAQIGWEQMGFDGRAKVLLRAQKWVTENADRIIETIISETGKTWEDAQLAEVGYASSAFGFWSKNAPKYLADEKIPARSPFVLGRRLVVRYRPLGLVGVIGPWNFPLTNSFGDCIPALAAGNACILKPATATPLTSLLMEQMMLECGCPENVFQVATGSGSETGTALIDEVDFIMFTGSTETGKKIMARASQTLTPVGLELGGKDPMIVLRDADIERAANAAAYYSMNNGGQVCISVERVYVEEPIYDEFVSKVTQKVGALRQGVPNGPASIEIGAMIVPSQIEIVDAHVKDAVAKGARVLTGGKQGAGPGSFYEPTVIADANHTMTCMTEETFGPTVPIMKVADADEAVRLANDSPYGLAASVWTKDSTRGEKIARQVEAGAVCVNDAQLNYFALELPMGGWKESGMGSRHGQYGIRKYCAQQTLLITRLAPKKDIHMFPYRPWRTKLLGRVNKLLYGRGRRG